MTGFSVYTFTDAAGDVIYIGCTIHLERRLNDHRRTKAWWPEVANVRAFTVNGLAEAREVEDELQEIHRPRYCMTLRQRARHSAECSRAFRRRVAEAHAAGVRCEHARCWHCEYRLGVAA